MTIRVPLETIFVSRDGKQFAPKIGEAFDFTEEEMADINRVNPEAVRNPVSEVGEVEEAAVVPPTKPVKKTVAESPEL